MPGWAPLSINDGKSQKTLYCGCPAWCFTLALSRRYITGPSANKPGGWWPRTLCSSCDCWHSTTASPYVTEVMRLSQIKQAITNTLSDVISHSVNSQSVSSTPVDPWDCICVQYTDCLSCHYSLHSKASQLILHHVHSLGIMGSLGRSFIKYTRQAAHGYMKITRQCI